MRLREIPILSPTVIPARGLPLSRLIPIVNPFSPSAHLRVRASRVFQSGARFPTQTRHPHHRRHRSRGRARTGIQTRTIIATRTQTPTDLRKHRHRSRQIVPTSFQSLCHSPPTRRHRRHLYPDQRLQSHHSGDRVLLITREQRTNHESARKGVTRNETNRSPEQTIFVQSISKTPY